MSSDDRAYLVDVLDAASQARSFVAGMSQAEFAADTRTQKAVLYCFAIIGEASGHVTSETRARLALDWQAMRGMRNRLVHVYRDVDLDLVWATMRDDLPRLIEEIERYLASPSS